MAASGSTPQRRDSNVRRGRRVRAAVVLAGVLGSLGFAGYAASTAATGSTVTAASPSPAGTPAPVTTWAGDDGEGFSTAAPALQPGSGQVHATTSGSVHVTTGAVAPSGPAAAPVAPVAPTSQGPPAPAGQ